MLEIVGVLKILHKSISINVSLNQIQIQYINISSLDQCDLFEYKNMIKGLFLVEHTNIGLWEWVFLNVDFFFVKLINV